MYYANIIGLVVVLSVTVANGELFAACLYFADKPNGVVLLLVRSLTFYWAVLSYTMIIKEAGAVTAVSVGVARKIVTVLFSFVFFPKPFHVFYVYGTIIFVLALALETKNNLEKKRHRAGHSSTGLKSQLRSENKTHAV